MSFAVKIQLAWKWASAFGAPDDDEVGVVPAHEAVSCRQRLASTLAS